MFGLDDRFFDPLWIRVLVTAVTLGWAVVEFATGAPFWGVLFAGAGAVCIWAFFLTPRERRDEDEKETPPDE